MLTPVLPFTSFTMWQHKDNMALWWLSLMNRMLPLYCAFSLSPLGEMISLSLSSSLVQRLMWWISLAAMFSPLNPVTPPQRPTALHRCCFSTLEFMNTGENSIVFTSLPCSGITANVLLSSPVTNYWFRVRSMIISLNLAIKSWTSFQGHMAHIALFVQVCITDSGSAIDVPVLTLAVKN